MLPFAIACQSLDNQIEPEETEVWELVPENIDPGSLFNKEPPADSIVLFGGSNISD